MEKGSAGPKPIKIKLLKQDQEPEDFIRKIRQETTDEEAEEEPTETLVRRSKKRDWEQQAEEPAPFMVVETQAREEPVGGRRNERTKKPEPDKEQVLPRGLSLTQPKQQPGPPLNEEIQSTSTDGKGQELEHGTC